jgi:hypothetical protein
LVDKSLASAEKTLEYDKVRVRCRGAVSAVAGFKYAYSDVAFWARSFQLCGWCRPGIPAKHPLKLAEELKLLSKSSGI